MPCLKEIELIEVLAELPDIEALNIKRDFRDKKDDLFICALGFEERCICIPEMVKDLGVYKCSESIFFEYTTNVADNDLNRNRLLAALQSFSNSIRPMDCDKEDFTSRLRELLFQYCHEERAPNILFDISSCSSRLLLLTLKVFFEFNLNLHILYSEAAKYHPTNKEYEEDPQKWTTEEGFGIAKGVGKIIPSPEHPGSRRDRLPEAVIVFPTFKPERTRAVITYIDDSLINKPGDQVTWIIGDPHLPEDHWRTDIIKQINKIPQNVSCYEVSTFYYKKTVEKLESIYKTRDCKSLITISPLGSKLQSLGISLFWQIRQDISIVFAIPEQYNARQYSEGCKAKWQVNLGNLFKLRELLNSVGRLKLMV